MSHKSELRNQRNNTIINVTSTKEDKKCMSAVMRVVDDLKMKFDVDIIIKKRVQLEEVIQHLKSLYPNVDFSNVKSTSFMSPDGGVAFLRSKDGIEYPILITEVKNQGTNDLRSLEGKPKQAQGNAIERLGKNVIGFRTFMLNENIFPFVCFGDGCDFAEGSSILDRVVTIAMFGELNIDHTSNEGPGGLFNRGSYYFRGPYWTSAEMYDIMYSVAKKSIYYYFSKYGEERFVEDKELELVGAL